MLNITKQDKKPLDFNTNRLIVKLNKAVCQASPVIAKSTKDASQNVKPTEDTKEEHMFEIY